MKGRKKKKLVMQNIMCIVGAVSAMLLLGGCSFGTDKTTDESNTAPSQSSVQTKPESRKISLTVWGPSEDQAPESGNWLIEMCEQFDRIHDEWDITFTYGVCAEGDAKATVTQDVDAAADVYMFANDNLTDLISSNAIAKIGGTALNYVEENMSQTLVDSVTVDGSVYGIPFTTNTWFLYYDKRVLQEDDIKSLEGMLKKGKVAFPLSNSWYIQAFYVANGCTFFGDGTNEEAGIDFSGEKAIAVTDYLVDLVANPNFVNDASGEALAGFQDDSVIAMFSGSWDYKDIADAIGEENVGAASLPTISIGGAEKTLYSFFGSKAIGVNPTSDQMEVAMKLAVYLGGEDAQKAHYDMRKILPTNESVLEDPAIAEDIVAIATNDTIANTSIMQPYCQAMGNYWSPAENFGKALIAKEVTHKNAVEKTESLHKSLNTSVVD